MVYRITKGLLEFYKKGFEKNRAELVETQALNKKLEVQLTKQVLGRIKVDERLRNARAKYKALEKRLEKSTPKLEEITSDPSSSESVQRSLGPPFDLANGCTPMGWKYG